MSVFPSFLSNVDKAKTIVLGAREDGNEIEGGQSHFRKCGTARKDLGPLLAISLGMPGEEDFQLARLARLEAMLHDLIGEHARAKGERAAHLADAICDLRTLIDRVRHERPQRYVQ
jgi:hypothetical protein